MDIAFNDTSTILSVYQMGAYSCYLLYDTWCLYYKSELRCWRFRSTLQIILISFYGIEGKSIAFDGIEVISSYFSHQKNILK